MDVDYLLLADGAQVAGDKLYVLGGGWITIWADKFPVTHSMAVAVGILVDWNETNRQHDFRMEVREEDLEHRTIVRVDGAFEQGRPTGIPAGARQRIQMAVPLQIPLARSGEYEVRFFLNGKQEKRSPFTVIDRTQTGLRPPTQGAPVS